MLTLTKCMVWVDFLSELFIIMVTRPMAFSYSFDTDSFHCDIYDPCIRFLFWLIWLFFFPEFFANWDLFPREFLPKNGWFYNFFFAICVNFLKPKWDPCLRIFGEKVYNSFGRHIPVYLKGALDNFSLIPKFFSKKLRFLYH